MHRDKADGCELPEELRRYYLDAMGIQVWEELDIQDFLSVAAVTEDRASVEPSSSVNKSQTSIINVEVSNCDWEELRAAVEQCRLCELCNTRKQTVFGTGNQSADLLVIGEAPGQDEDAQGEPFVGEAGQLLTAMLKAIKLEREQVYITNVLKCQPPNNRDPLVDEIKNCHSYLYRQIALLQPKAIYVVGRIAAQALLNSKESISKLRLHQHNFEGIPVIASYHPAYLLRKPSEKKAAWHDLQQLQKLLEA
ncbi:MAG: uracil-DNA glycosylase [Gammaproteobacteria bacterium]|nr:uracil-DNA glycosylase [Gammaproteobacteria bacterium]